MSLAIAARVTPPCRTTTLQGPQSFLTEYVECDIGKDMSKKPKPSDLADQLRAAFRESQMSRFELARRAGISYAIIHRFVAGERGITLASASKIAGVLGLGLSRVQPRRTKRK